MYESQIRRLQALLLGQAFTPQTSCNVADEKATMSAIAAKWQKKGPLLAAPGASRRKEEEEESGGVLRRSNLTTFDSWFRIVPNRKTLLLILQRWRTSYRKCLYLRELSRPEASRLPRGTSVYPLRS